MIQNSTSRRRPGATVAGIFGLAAVSALLLCGAGSVPVENFAPQGPMQSDLNAGGRNITNADLLAATNSVSAPVVTASVSFSSDAGAITSDGGGDVTMNTLSCSTISSDGGFIYSDGIGNFFAGDGLPTGGLNGGGLSIDDTFGQLLKAFGGYIAGDYGAWFSDGAGGLTMTTLTSDEGVIASDSMGDLTIGGTLTIGSQIFSDGAGNFYGPDGGPFYASGGLTYQDGSPLTDNSGDLYSNLAGGSIIVSRGASVATRAATATDLPALLAPAPASSTGAGTPGEIAYDSNYIYVCVAANAWKRAALSSW